MAVGCFAGFILVFILAIASGYRSARRQQRFHQHMRRYQSEKIFKRWGK
jgi:uncharacterized membrane protein